MESVKRSHTQLWGSSHAPQVAARHTITTPSHLGMSPSPISKHRLALLSL